MKRLNSKTTFLSKKLFPIIMFGTLAISLGGEIFESIAGNGPGILFIVLTLGMIVLFYIYMKKNIWDLMDDVYDEGASLLLKKSGKEVRINLSDIKNVSYTTRTNPHRVTLSIRHTTELGDELSFSPPISWLPFKKNEDIEVFIERIDKARC